MYVLSYRRPSWASRASDECRASPRTLRLSVGSRRAAAEAERRRQEEERRRQELERQAEAWAKAQFLRAYIDAVERESAERGLSVFPESELGRWLPWARDHADRLDPTRGGKA